MGAESRIARLLEAKTAHLAAGVAFLAATVVAREIHQRRKTERKKVPVQQAAEDIDTGEAGVIFVRGKSSFIRAV